MLCVALVVYVVRRTRRRRRAQLRFAQKAVSLDASDGWAGNPYFAKRPAPRKTLAARIAAWVYRDSGALEGQWPTLAAGFKPRHSGLTQAPRSDSHHVHMPVKHRRRRHDIGILVQMLHARRNRELAAQRARARATPLLKLARSPNPVPTPTPQPTSAPKPTACVDDVQLIEQFQPPVPSPPIKRSVVFRKNGDDELKLVRGKRLRSSMVFLPTQARDDQLHLPVSLPNTASETPQVVVEDDVVIPPVPKAKAPVSPLKSGGREKPARKRVVKLEPIAADEGNVVGADGVASLQSPQTLSSPPPSGALRSLGMYRSSAVTARTRGTPHFPSVTPKRLADNRDTKQKPTFVRLDAV
jgi:hypothetical protein